MSLITKNNYEAYLLDYVEKNLSPELVAELMLFLENNPNLNVNLADFEIIPLQVENKYFPNKNILKKEETIVNSTNYEDFLIAEIEGINTIENSTELRIFLKNNTVKQQEFLIYKKTKLTAPNIVFKEKKSLYLKQKKVIPLYWWYSSAAAVLILVFFLKVMYKQNGKPNFFAKTQPKEIIKTNKVQSKLYKKLTSHVTKKNNNLVKATKKTHSIIKVKKQKIKPITNKLLAQIIKKDTTKTILPPLKEQENLYANNVKITFDDEVKQPVNIPKKLTKMAILKKLFKKPFAKIFHQQKNKDGVVVAYAFNMGKIGFSRKKRIKN